MSGIELIKRAGEFGQRTAVEDRTGNFTYADLLRVSRFAALNLLGDEKDLEEKRVAFLVPPEFEYVALKLGVWMAGGVSVPLGTAHSPREIKYVIEDSCAETVVFHPDLAQKLEGVFIRYRRAVPEASGSFAACPRRTSRDFRREKGNDHIHKRHYL